MLTEAQPKVSLDEPVIIEKNADETVSNTSTSMSLAELSPERWYSLYCLLAPGGLLQNTLSNSELIHCDGNRLSFRLDERYSALFDEKQVDNINHLLSDYFDQTVTATVSVGTIDGITPSMVIIEQKQQALVRAKQAIYGHSIVRALQNQFDAIVDDESIEAII